MVAKEKITREEVLSYLQEKKETLFSKYQIVRLGLFGSFAKNEATSESDIDLIVDFQPNTPGLHDKKLEIKHLVKSHFGREVDICTEKYVKPYYRQQILSSVIYV